GRAGDGLRQHLSARIEHACREVAGFAHRCREGGPEKGQRLFLDHRDQPVPHDLHADFTNVAHAWLPLRIRRMPPSLCRTASKGVVTRVEVSRSTMTAGPVMRPPAESVSRSTIA